MKSFCSFALENGLYGVPVDAVQEVLRGQELTPLPLAPKAVCGLLHLRGQILTVVDMRARLGLPPRPEKLPPVHMLVRQGAESVSFLVDRVGEVVGVNDDQFEAPPERVMRSFGGLIQGAYKLSTGLLLSLDVGKALDLA